MLSGALRRSTRRAVVQLPRRSFGGHGHAAPVAQPGDFVAKPPASPSTVAFFGESLGGLITSTTSNGTFAALSSRGMWPWLAGFGATFWLVGKMGTSREEIEVSKNPGYAEKTALGYVAEDARRFRAATKAADDVVFEEFASKKAEDFAALSAADKKVKQDAFAEELVQFRIKQAKEAQLKWLALTEKKMELTVASFH